ncbi:MAG TPA: hypothetical protein VF175_04260 [Lacipirellula sp.]
MKSEERHKLQENVLARELGTWTERVRPYTSIILTVVAGLLGVYIVASLWNSYQATRDRAAWDDYQLAVLEGDVEQKALRRLADSEDHAGTEMQEWALMGWADRQLLRASQLYLTSRDEAVDRVNDVIGVYEQFASRGSNPEIRNRAQLGLARAFEMKGELDEARAHYERVEGALSEVADQRLRELEGEQVEKTVEWLATAELPKPTAPGGPGTPGSRPGFEATVPPTDAATSAAEAAMTDIFGGLEAEDPSRYETPAEGAGEAPAESPAETPAADGEAAADGEPTAEQPAENANAEAEPPAAETPAAEAPAADGAAEEPAVPAAEDAGEEPAAEEPATEQPAAADAPSGQ